MAAYFFIGKQKSHRICGFFVVPLGLEPRTP